DGREMRRASMALCMLDRYHIPEVIGGQSELRLLQFPEELQNCVNPQMAERLGVGLAAVEPQIEPFIGEADDKHNLLRGQPSSLLAGHRTCLSRRQITHITDIHQLLHADRHIAHRIPVAPGESEDRPIVVDFPLNTVGAEVRKMQAGMSLLKYESK